MRYNTRAVPKTGTAFFFIRNDGEFIRPIAPPRNRRRNLSGLERFRRDAKAIGPGVLVSLAAHVVVLLILGFVAIRVRHSDRFDSFVATWDPDGEIIVSPPDRSKTKNVVPVEVASTTSSIEPEKSTSTKVDVDRTGEAIGVAPVGVSGVLAGRSARTRNGSKEHPGGSMESERAINAGLGWLSRQQTGDGHWELHQGYPDAGRPYIKTDTGATALALLAFLGHGETHQIGEHRTVVAKGLKWLREIQDPASGDLHDQRQEEGRNGAFYAHAMGTIVLCEALALTQDDQLRPSAERAVKYLIASQHPEMGGWKYRPLNQRVMSGDISVTAWALMALQTARVAGIDVKNEEFERTSRFLDRVQEQNGARYKYEPDEPESRVTPARTAIGLLCRQWLGWPKTHPPMIDGAKFLMEEHHRPQWTAGRRNVFEWYYITQVMHNMGGDEWNEWNSAVRDTVTRNQLITGSSKSGQDIRGSWNPKPEGQGEEYADKAGRLYLTSMCILILETPYRHKPVYEN